MGRFTTPGEQRVLRERRARQASALARFQSSPDFPGIQVRTHDRIRLLIDGDPSVENLPQRTEARMDYFVKVFDIRAEELLLLVIDKETHDAYGLVLEQFADWVWEQWSGYPLTFVPPVGHAWRTQFDRLIPRARHWMLEGYRKRDAKSKIEESGQVPEALLETMPSIENLKAQRAKMLSDYKAATGNPPNMKIYGATNSGIYKPQFYEWLSGNLAPDSATTINLETFLKRKKPPIPREK